MTSQIIQFLPLDDFNQWVNFWYYNVGMNVITTNAEKKLPIVKWSQYQNESIAEELLAQWIHEERFKNGIGVITGKIWRGRHAGKYLTAVDLDNKLAIDEFSNYVGTKVCWQNITFVETRGDGKGKLHLYFISHEQIPDKEVDNAPEMIDKKDANLAPSVEVKGSFKGRGFNLTSFSNLII